MSEEQKRKRRSPGENGVYWSEERQRYIAEKTVGYDARGKRIKRKGSGTSETAALREMRRRVKDYEAGLVLGSEHYRVRQAVEDWLRYGQSKAIDGTRQKNEDLCRVNLLPHLGERKLRELQASEVEAWLEGLSVRLSTSSLRQVHSCLNRAVRRAMRRNLADRNVVELCDVPTGQEGRPSKSLTLAQAQDVLTLSVDDPLHCYIVVSLLTGARTEEVRPLQWRHVHLEGDADANPPIPPHLEVWRSVRSSGDTKTRKSRRTLALPALVVEKLREHEAGQREQAGLVGEEWTRDRLVFPTRQGTVMDSANVRRDFRRALRVVNAEKQEREGPGTAPVLDPEEWTPRELRHSFVSLLSESGLRIEDISMLVGHKGTHVTELVYRHQLRPVIQTGAQAMDGLFSMPTGEA